MSGLWCLTGGNILCYYHRYNVTCLLAITQKHYTRLIHTTTIVDRIIEYAIVAGSSPQP